VPLFRQAWGMATPVSHRGILEEQDVV
jgi:hypothetical protein